jgi:hypothetical protein
MPIPNAKTVWRKFVVDGVPSSGPHQPKKDDASAWGQWIEASLATLAQVLSASVARATKAELDAVIADYDNGDIGLVVLDEDEDLRGVYRKEGGIWVKKAGLPDEAALLAQEAADAAEAAKDIAVAAAAGVDLPLVAPNRMLVDNSAGTMRESKTFPQVRALLNPLFGFALDGSTNDDAEFSAFEASVSGQDIDLGETFPLVTVIPAMNRYRNGGFSVANYEGSAKAIIPTPDFIPTQVVALTAGPQQSLWAQDKCHEWDGVIYVFYVEGTQHSTSDPFKYIVCRRYQHGVFSAPERLFRYYDGVGRSSFSAGVTEGVQWVYLRNDTTLGQKLFARRLPQRYELTRCIDTTNLSPEFDIDFADAGVAIGAVEGMKATFGNVGTVGGLAISGEYPVSFVNGARIQFTHGSNASAPVTNGGGTGGEGGVYFNLIFNESDWVEVPIGGGEVGAALDAAGAGAGANVHSFAAQQPTTAHAVDFGTHFVGVSGGTINLAIAKIFRPMDANGAGSRVVSWITQIAGSSDLSEPTVNLEGDNNGGKFRGFCRSNADTTPSIFWTGDFAGGLLTNIQTWNMDTGANVQSPIPLVVTDDDIFALCSATRYGQNNGSTGLNAAPVDMYLLHAKKADADANGWAAFKRFVITKSFFANHFFAVNNGVGVGSLVQVDECTLMAVFGIEATGENPAIGPSRIYAALIDVSRLAGVARKYPLPVPQVVDLASGYWQYRGLGAIADAGYLIFTTPVSQVAPVIYDASTGYITAVEPCTLEITIQVQYGAGTVGERSCTFVDAADVDLLGFVVASENTRSTDASDYKTGTSTFTKQFRAGEKGRFKVSAPNGTRSTTTRSVLQIRKLV